MVARGTMHSRFQDELLKKPSFPNAVLMLSLKQSESTCRREKTLIFHLVLGT